MCQPISQIIYFFRKNICKCSARVHQDEWISALLFVLIRMSVLFMQAHGSAVARNKKTQLHDFRGTKLIDGNDSSRDWVEDLFFVEFADIFLVWFFLSQFIMFIC